jgi:hypothetical protein
MTVIELQDARRRWWLMACAIVGVALISSFNGIWNGFAYDDLYIVAGNDLIHDLGRAWRLFLLPYWPIRLGGDGYRPLTLVVFAAQWAMGRGSPMFFHAVTILLYAVTCVSIFWLTTLVMDTAYAWLAAALFAVHPVHVEAVANVVGQAEVWAGLLMILATAFYIRCRRDGRFGHRRQFAIALMYLAACLFKEHAISLPILLLASEYFILAGDDSLAGRLRALRPFYLGLLTIAAVYVALRGVILHKEFSGFTPFIPFVSLHVGYVDRVLTMLEVVPQWARLLLWPAVLAAEYGPPAYPIAHGPAWLQLPGILVVSAILTSIVLLRRRAPVVAFGLSWTVLTLLPSSNFILPSGILFAERTLFTPSVGIVVAVCGALPPLVGLLRTPYSRITVLAAVEALLVLGAAKSVIQTAVWRNNDSLFRDGIRSSPMVYRSHYMLGAWLMATKNYASGEREYLKAMQLFPYDPFVPYNLGQEYFHAGLYEQAYRMYERAERIMPNFQDAQAQMALARAMQGRYTEARQLATRAMRNGIGDSATLRAVLTASSLDERARAGVVSAVGKPERAVVVR